MGFTKITAMISAAASLALAAYQGNETVNYVMNANMITGTGVYSGDPLRPGEYGIVDWALVKRTDCPGWNTRIWRGENGFYVVEPKMPTTLPKSEEPKSYAIETKIPELAPPGVLKLSIVGQYECETSVHNFTLGPVEIPVRG